MTDLPAPLGALPLRVERCDLQPLAFETPNFTRVTTVVESTGGGHVGRGEDVTYTPTDQDEHRAHAPFRLAGEDTLAGWLDRLDGIALFGTAPQEPSAPDYRRWAYESALLDLALRQAGTTLGEALGRALERVRKMTA